MIGLSLRAGAVGLAGGRNANIAAELATAELARQLVDIERPVASTRQADGVFGVHPGKPQTIANLVTCQIHRERSGERVLRACF